ncbi:hypothetical protein DL93DRAFT_2062727 [Clavulina sp. PMI_390]|nr:hypothetical protein DL93DRAFT_2062727 [Clavulina sp. PMI_390]
MSEEPLFDVTLKKKKKKAVAFNEDPLGVEGGAPAPTFLTVRACLPMFVSPVLLDRTLSTSNDPDEPAAADAAPTGDFSDLKKKKKKRATFDIDALEAPSEPASGTSTPAPVSLYFGDDLADFAKKKKKSKKAAAFDLEAFEKELEETSKPASSSKDKDAEGGDDDEDEDGEPAPIEYDEADLGDDVFAGGGGGGGAGSGASGADVETWHGTDRDYTYAELLGRIMRTLHAQNPELSSGGRKRYTIVPPSVHREGNKKTIFANVVDICKRMHRQPEHVISFLFAELGTNGSVDGEKRLVIKGRFQPKQIENVLRRYIVEYVTCKTCKSPDTVMSKENRLYFMTCESCGSKRSVSAIKTGFQAQIGKRKKKVV